MQQEGASLQTLVRAAIMTVLPVPQKLLQTAKACSLGAENVSDS